MWGDTDKVARGEGTMGSRSLQVGGSAVLQASEIVIEEAKKIAAELLEANVDDVVLETSNGTFHVTGTPAVSRTWAEVATAAMERDEIRRGALRSDRLPREVDDVPVRRARRSGRRRHRDRQSRPAADGHV